MLFLYTDFGYEGPYVGQMKAVLQYQAPSVPVIDLMHDAPVCDPKSSAYLLAALAPRLPANAIVVGVVDPGVGAETRRPIVLRADSRWYVGPDNGLFELVARAAKSTRWWEIHWRPEILSSSFHGRDVFAPVAACIASQGVNSEQLRSVEPALKYDWNSDLQAIIYVDHFGNLVTGLRACTIDSKKRLAVAGKTVEFARTFSSVPLGQVFWYGNSNDLVEISVNQGRADKVLQLGIGDRFEVR